MGWQDRSDADESPIPLELAIQIVQEGKNYHKLAHTFCQGLHLHAQYRASY